MAQKRKPRIIMPERTMPKTPVVPKAQPIKALKNMETIFLKCKEMTEKYAGQYELCTDPDRLYKLIEKSNSNGRIALDTETTGLDVFTEQVVGFSIFTEGIKAAYIPLRHLSRFTGKIDTAQPKIEEVVEVLKELKPTTTIDFANAQFDLLMMKYSLGVDYIENPRNDALIAARLLDTERKAGNRNLKALHADYCSHSTRGPRFGELFPAGQFNLCPFSLGYTYAARDAEMTWELMDYLNDWLDREPPLRKVYDEIEMPLIPVLIRMRERGVLVDQAKRVELTHKYQKLMEEAEIKFEQLYAPYIPKIRQYQQSPDFRKPKGRIELPVKIGSDDQIKILFWKIMNLPHDPSNTSVDAAACSKTNSEIAKVLLEYRACKKLLSTYLEGLEKHIRPDGRVRGSIRQIGADTGRTSSVDPNLQNIPSRNKEIRQIYIASPGYALISCDYSGQEPRLTASLCRDEKMIQTYVSGQDLYSMIAAVAFNVPYEDCREEKPDGSYYAEGKWRRSQAKTIVLGICYGRQIPSIAEQLGCSVDKAKEIYDKVTTAFPGLLAAQNEAAEQAHTLGYVTTLWGRRRHLSAMKHDDYEFEYAPGCNPDFDPFNPDLDALDNKVPESIAKDLLSQISKIKWYKDKQSFIANLRSERGIIVHDYSRIRNDVSRKCLNARIQGSAADMSKLAMIAVDNDPRLRALDCHLELMVHDELICEAPKQNIHEVVPIIQELMQNVASELPVPFKSDAEVSEVWYGKKINYSEEDDI